MGRRKSLMPIFLFFVLVFTINSCSLLMYAALALNMGDPGPSAKPKKVVITSISLTENNKIIRCERRGAFNLFDDKFYVFYRNIPIKMYFDVQIEESQNSGDYSTVTLTVDLTDIPRIVYNEEDELRNKHRIKRNVLYINEEAVFYFTMRGAGLIAEVFIKENGVDILEQRFYLTDDI